MQTMKLKFEHKLVASYVLDISLACNVLRTVKSVVFWDQNGIGDGDNLNIDFLKLKMDTTL